MGLKTAGYGNPPRRFLRQFHNLLIHMLLSASCAALFLQHWMDAAFSFDAILAMASIGAFQEGRAEQARRAIRKLLSHQAIVRRGDRRSADARGQGGHAM